MLPPQQGLELVSVERNQMGLDLIQEVKEAIQRKKKTPNLKRIQIQAQMVLSSLESLREQKERNLSLHRQREGRLGGILKTQ